MIKYQDRLEIWRTIFFTILVLLWLFVILTTGFSNGGWQFTVLLIIVGYLGRPRNAAKILAKRALRQQSLNEAVEEEIRRRKV